MTISVIGREDDFLVVNVKISGTMPMTAQLGPADARAALRLMGLRTILFALTLHFRPHRR